MLMKAIDWWMVAIFFAIVVAIPLVTTFFNRGTSKDFLLAGRSMPWWLLGFSMTAACTSTDSANLFTEIIRKDGLAGNWVWWSFLVAEVFSCALSLVFMAYTNKKIILPLYEHPAR